MKASGKEDKVNMTLFKVDGHLAHAFAGLRRDALEQASSTSASGGEGTERPEEKSPSETVGSAGNKANALSNGQRIGADPTASLGPLCSQKTHGDIGRHFEYISARTVSFLVIVDFQLWITSQTNQQTGFWQQAPTSPWAGSDGGPWTALHCQQLLIGVVITEAMVQACSAFCIALVQLRGKATSQYFHEGPFPVQRRSNVFVMIAWAHCACCVTSSTRHGSHSLQQLRMAFSISPLTSILQLVCGSVS